jgi:putative membrane protein
MASESNGIGKRDDKMDPDVRFSYANERTFLAWIRSALGLVTAGLAITQLLPPFDFTGGRRLIGLPLIPLGVIVALLSLHSWQANERAMRLGRALPRSPLRLSRLLSCRSSRSPASFSRCSKARADERLRSRIAQPRPCR